MSLVALILILHAVTSTVGYVGLIATNAVLLVLCRIQTPQTLLDAFTKWRKAHRLFHPILGTGILSGFALLYAAHDALAAPWLLASYALVVLGMLANALIFVPWQRKAERSLSRSQMVSTSPVQLVSGVFVVAYIAIVSLMMLRPL